MNELDKENWAGRVRTLLDESADGLDAATLSRLNRARQAALAQARPRAVRRWFLPAGMASACMLLVAVFAWHSYGPTGASSLPPSLSELLPSTASASAAGGDIDLVSSDDSLELFQDLEFYAWLDAQDQGSDG